MLSNLIQQQIKEAALKTPNEEICGLLVESGNFYGFIQCTNKSSNKKNHFEISPFDYLNIAETNKIIGILHSQRSSVPSSLDIINAFGHNLKSYIYSIDGDIFIEVTEKHLKYGRYLNQKFEIGKQDCYTLIKNFYQQEFNIEINNYPRTDSWFKENPNIIKENYEREGFVEVDNIKNAKEGDVIVFSWGHMAIFLEKDLILHIKRDKPSIIEMLNDSYLSRITGIYRHKTRKYE